MNNEILSKFYSRLEKGFYFSLILYAGSLPFSMSVTNIALGLVLFFTVSLLLNRRLHWLLPKSIFFILIFFLWVSVTIWLNEKSFRWSGLESFSKIWNLLPYFLIPLGYRIIQKNVDKVLKTLVLSGCFVVLLGVFQYLTGIHYFFEKWFKNKSLVDLQRFHGFQSHPLHSAALYTILFLISLSMALFYRSYGGGIMIEPGKQLSSSKIKKFWYAISVILGFGVLLTVSRSYYLAVTGGVMILLAMRGWKSFFTGIFIGVVSVFLISRVIPYVGQRISAIRPSHTDEAGRQRIWIWKSAFFMIKDNPFCGVGYKKWKEHLENYIPLFPEWQNIDPAAYGHAHNSYLTVTSETGMIGLIFFLMFWGYLLKEEFKALFSLKKDTYAYALTTGSIVSIIAVLIAALFEHNLLTATLSLTLFFVIGLSRAARRSY